MYAFPPSNLSLFSFPRKLPNPSEVAAHVKCFAKIEATKLYPIVKEYFKYGHIKTKPYRKLEEVKQVRVHMYLCRDG